MTEQSKVYAVESPWRRAVQENATAREGRRVNNVEGLRG